MPGFKDQIALDRAIFFNITEFADNHVVDGKTLVAVLDNDQLRERSKKEYDGLSVGELLFYVKAEDFGDLPAPGKPLVFDGRQMYVFDAREELGVYEIILSQNRGV